MARPSHDDGSKVPGASRQGGGLSPAPPVHVEVSYDPRVNFAMQQASVQLVKQVRVRNVAPGPLGNLTVSIWTEPEVTGRVDLRIAAIRKGETYNIDRVNLPLEARKLATQAEREAGALRVEVRSGQRLLLSQSSPFEVLAYNEWNGVTSLPEILAAFVLPNDPAVDRILGMVREIVQGRTGDPSLDGYASRNPNRVMAMINAVYDALMALDLAYIHPPASFELTGQKVRPPGRILETRMGTCLDLSLFAAACLEQAGLNPLVIVLADHAFCGAWVTDQSFADPSTDERQKIRNRALVDQIAVFEMTGLTRRPQISFPQSCTEGLLHLEKAYAFEFALDVKSARRASIRPLPIRASGEGTAPAAKAFHAKAPPLRLFDVLAKDREQQESETQSPRTRVDRWKRRLLDLSLRNRLINFRDTRKTIPLLVPDVVALEDALADGATLALAPRPRVLSRIRAPEVEQARAEGQDDPRRVYLVQEMGLGRLHSSLVNEELTKRLVNTYRAARVSLEENGANTLFLALGFLSWFETPKSEEERRAPILLLPVEMLRTNVRSGFRIRLLEEEPRLNVTLLQKLETDFGLDLKHLDGLPEDQHGVDVARLLRDVRRAVLPFERWGVVEEARLGLFSFQKFLMWRDLQERSKALSQNAVVRHLVEQPEEDFAAGASFPDEALLDERYDPAETFCPLDADSSQLSAIFAAASGQSFVLQGPPGTGKSQTITNLIAHCLAQGQRVLLVAEKRAALEVVRTRLERTGLGPFALALHSNKTRKKDVHEQLRQALETARTSESPQWKAASGELKRLRETLNGYCRALHRTRGLGHSAFVGLARLIGLRDETLISLNLGEEDAVDAAALSDLRDRVEVLRAESETVDGIAHHPLAPVQLEEWTPEVVDRSRRACDDLLAAVKQLREEAQPVAAVMGIESRSWSRIDVQHMGRWQALLASAKETTRELLSVRDWSGTGTRLAEWIVRGRKRDELREGLFARYESGILALDHGALGERLSAAMDRFVLVRWATTLPARFKLRRVWREGKLPPNEELLTDVKLAAEVKVRTERLTDPGCEAAGLFARHWAGAEADWDKLQGMLRWVGALHGLLMDVAGMNFEESERLRTLWIELALDPPEAVTQDLDAFHAAHFMAKAAKDRLTRLLDLDVDRAWGTAEAPGALDRMVDVADSILEHAGSLRIWSGYAQARREAAEAGLFPLIDAIEHGRLPVNSLGGAFDRSFHEWWLNAVLDAEPVLGGFSSTRHTVAVSRFREVDRHVTELAQQVVHALLAARVPRGGGADAAGSKSEMGLLHRELQKRSRHKPIRRLFAEIPNVLARIKPCMLMSPLAVAQYLDADFPAFDLVVFDEASQIPVWDAVGAIGRGKSVVVVGDSRQLPPTSFFMREEAEDAFDEDEIEDLESVLDECVAARLPVRSLKWHYRSRHESLIAFSNHHYYAGKLFTFPSPQVRADRRGVSLRLVHDGVYDKGRTRTNRREAETLVDEVVRRLWDPFEGQRSIGIVTFSLSQQTLIEDLLEQRRFEHPEIEPYFTGDVVEPLFVKNLESVQGDERDVILFSIGYGPDDTGRVAMNFGPLNRDGGERRLNVAITRAREEVIVFSSMRAEQIDLARTRSAGVRDLRTFLDYAARGPAAIAEAELGAEQADWSTPFEQDVQFALEARGLRVRAQVGCSGYRLDLAVEHPDDPDTLALGITCDGAMYNTGHTARDRDRLRDEVLVGLGWRMLRVWVVDWWYEPEREVERVLEEYQRALAELTVRPGPKPVFDPTITMEPGIFSGTLPGLGEGVKLVADQSAGPPTGPISQQVMERMMLEPKRMEQYAPLFPDQREGTPDEIFEDPAAPRIRDLIRRILEAEAPIIVDLLLRRVAAFWGSPRMTRRLVERLQRVLPSSGAKVVLEEGQYVAWRENQDPETYAAFRLGGVETARTAEHLPLAEIANAAHYVLSAHVSIEREALARETARLFGISRMGGKVRAAMDKGIHRLASRGQCVVDGEMVRLPY